MHQRRVGQEPSPPVHDLRQLLHRPQVVPAARLLHRRLRRLRLRLAQRPAVLPQEVVDVEPGVPDVDVRLRRELADRRPVGLARRPSRSSAAPCRPTPMLRAAISTLASSRFTSHSNGPGSVSSKSLRSKSIRRSGRAVEAEVRHVRVTAQLHVEPGVRGRREVGGHEQRGAAVERERGGRHAPVPQREQLGHPGQALGRPAGRPGRGASSSSRCPRGPRAGAAPGRPLLGPRARCGSGGATWSGLAPRSASTAGRGRQLRDRAPSRPVYRRRPSSSEPRLVGAPRGRAPALPARSHQDDGHPGETTVSPCRAETWASWTSYVATLDDVRVREGGPDVQRDERREHARHLRRRLAASGRRTGSPRRAPRRRARRPSPRPRAAVRRVAARSGRAASSPAATRARRSTRATARGTVHRRGTATAPSRRRTPACTARTGGATGAHRRRRPPAAAAAARRHQPRGRGDGTGISP